MHPKSPSSDNAKKPESPIEATDACVHRGEKVNVVTGAGDLNTKIGMAVVPMKVRAKGQRHWLETYAYLDSGSNTTFCTDKLMSQLSLQGIPTKLSLTTLNETRSKTNCALVELEVCDLDENEVVQLPQVFSTNSLPVTADDVPKQEDLERRDHLEGVHLTSIEADVCLLIGCDNPKALEP